MVPKIVAELKHLKSDYLKKPRSFNRHFA